MSLQVHMGGVQKVWAMGLKLGLALPDFVAYQIGCRSKLRLHLTSWLCLKMLWASIWRCWHPRSLTYILHECPGGVILFGLSGGGGVEESPWPGFKATNFDLDVPTVRNQGNSVTSSTVSSSTVSSSTVSVCCSMLLNKVAEKPI